MLYIYACLKKKCKDSSESVRVFRCQLSQSNKYFSERPPNYDLLGMSDAALADKMRDVLDAINGSEGEYKDAVKVQNESKKLSTIYMLEIEDEQERLTKKLLKKQALLEKGDEALEDYDSDDSQILNSKDKELLDKYQEEDKEEIDDSTGIIKV
jgi:hypothetical protein